MKSSKLPLIFIVLLGFVCVAQSNPISHLFGKSDSDKTETDDKAEVSTTTTVKPGETTTTTTANPSSSCGGLKGFLHICDKNEPTEPPKNVKTRSVPEEDSSEDSSDDDSDEKQSSKDDKDDKEKENGEDETQKDDKEEAKGEETPKTKRQTDDTEDPALKDKEEEQEEDESVKEDDSFEVEDAVRRKRDCRDRGDEYEKDCRRKRELVPPIEPKVKRDKSEKENE